MSMVKTDDARCEMIAQQLSWATTAVRQGGAPSVGPAFMFRWVFFTHRPNVKQPVRMPGEMRRGGILDRQFIEISGLEP